LTPVATVHYTLYMYSYEPEIENRVNLHFFWDSESAEHRQLSVSQLCVVFFPTQMKRDAESFFNIPCFLHDICNFHQEGYENFTESQYEVSQPIE